MSKEKEITGVLIKPKQYPKVVSVENRLESLQGVVGGLIQVISGLTPDNTDIICNDEGKLLGFDLNRSIRDSESNKVIDIFAGDMFVVGSNEEGEFISLTPEQIAEVKNLYYYPEVFFKYNDEIHAISLNWQINLVGDKEVVLTDRDTGEVKDVITCSDDNEQLRMGMYINRKKSEVLRNLDFEYSDYSLSAEDILNKAVDAFDDVWEDER